MRLQQLMIRSYLLWHPAYGTSFSFVIRTAFVFHKVLQRLIFQQGQFYWVVLLLICGGLSFVFFLLYVVCWLAYFYVLVFFLIIVTHLGFPKQERKGGYKYFNINQHSTTGFMQKEQYLVMEYLYFQCSSTVEFYILWKYVVLFSKSLNFFALLDVCVK